MAKQPSPRRRRLSSPIWEDLFSRRTRTAPSSPHSCKRRARATETFAGLNGTRRATRASASPTTGATAWARLPPGPPTATAAAAVDAAVGAAVRRLHLRVRCLCCCRKKSLQRGTRRRARRALSPPRPKMTSIRSRSRSRSPDLEVDVPSNDSLPRAVGRRGARSRQHHTPQPAARPPRPPSPGY